MDNGTSPSVFELVESGDRDRLLELLEGESDLSARDKGGRTALDLASLLGKAEVAQVLVDKGANVNLQNKSGFSLNKFSCERCFQPDCKQEATMLHCPPSCSGMGPAGMPESVGVGRGRPPSQDQAQRDGQRSCSEILQDRVCGLPRLCGCQVPVV